jgi:hypothetical protein
MKFSRIIKPFLFIFDFWLHVPHNILCILVALTLHYSRIKGPCTGKRWPNAYQATPTQLE